MLLHSAHLEAVAVEKLNPARGQEQAIYACSVDFTPLAHIAFRLRSFPGFAAYPDAVQVFFREMLVNVLLSARRCFHAWTPDPPSPSRDPDGQTRVMGGTGEHGARSPTGVGERHAVYRSGIGRPGSVEASPIGLLMTSPARGDGREEPPARERGRRPGGVRLAFRCPQASAPPPLSPRPLSVTPCAQASRSPRSRREHVPRREPSSLRPEPPSRLLRPDLGQPRAARSTAPPSGASPRAQRR